MVTFQKLWFKPDEILFEIFNKEPSCQVIVGKEPPATLWLYTPPDSHETDAEALIVIVVVDEILSYSPNICKSLPLPFAMVIVPLVKTNFPPTSISDWSIVTLAVTLITCPFLIVIILLVDVGEPLAATHDVPLYRSHEEVTFQLPEVALL